MIVIIIIIIITNIAFRQMLTIRANRPTMLVYRRLAMRSLNKRKLCGAIWRTSLAPMALR
jgi:hypothetical protein